MEFSRYSCLAYYSGLSLLTPGKLPTQESKPEYPALAGGFFTTVSPGQPIWCSKTAKTKKSSSIKGLRGSCLLGQLSATLPLPHPLFGSSLILLSLKSTKRQLNRHACIQTQGAILKGWIMIHLDHSWYSHSFLSNAGLGTDLQSFLSNDVWEEIRSGYFWKTFSFLTWTKKSF